MKKVSVITVNYNQQQVTEELLDSIRTCNTYPLLEIIVVDNGSSNNPIDTWKQCYEGIKFIRSEENLGFAGGNNLGINGATGDYFFLVNNDTEFTPQLVETLVAILDNNPRVGIVSPKIRFFYNPQIIQYAGFTPMDYRTARNYCVGEYQTDQGQFDSLTGPTGFAHGAAMMIRKEAIRAAGLMSENFFLYYEEMDWCERIRKQGYEVWIAPKALIYHKESMSTGKDSPLKEFFMNRNRILFIRKNGQRSAKWIFFFYFLGLVVPRNIVRYLLRGRFDLVLPLFRATSWNLTQHKESRKLGFPINSNS